MSRFLDSKFDGLVPYTPGEQPKDIIDLIKLNTNENPYPPCQGVIRVLNSEEAGKLNLYSDPTVEPLAAAIGEAFGLKSSQVMAGNGSDEILAFCFQGLCPDGAIFNNITYGFYEVFAEMFLVDATVIPLQDDFTIDIGAYEGLKGTIFLTNPNAPTGIALGLDDIRTILEQDRDRLLVLDEAYIDFGGDSASALIDEYDNLLVVQTFSKSRSLAGARLGFALGNEALIQDLNTMKYSFNPYNINRLTMKAGIEAISDRAYFNETRSRIMKTRERTVGALKEMGFKVLPSSSNFIFISPGEMMNCKEYFDKLRERSILVRYWDKDLIRDWTRVTIGTDQQMEAFLDATKAILEEAGAVR